MQGLSETVTVHFITCKLKEHESPRLQSTAGWKAFREDERRGAKWSEEERRGAKRSKVYENGNEGIHQEREVHQEHTGVMVRRAQTCSCIVR